MDDKARSHLMAILADLHSLCLRHGVEINGSDYELPYFHGPDFGFDGITVDASEATTGGYLDSGEERDRPPKLLDEMIAQGRLWVKAGKGFYDYPDPAYHDPAWLRKQGPYAADTAARLSAAEE